MRVLLAAALFLAACTDNTGSHFVEAELGPDGGLIVNSGENGRVGALYQAGSIAKLACTFAALELQRRGQLSLDSFINDLLPDYSGPGADRIRFLHLLQNRSGLRDEIIAALEANPNLASQSIPTIEAANRYAAGPVAEPPGASFDYVNSNWILVQAILEHVAAAPIDEVLDTLVFTPAGLKQTQVFVGELPGPDSVTPLEPVLPIPDYVACAGGLASTPEELIQLVKFPYHGSGFDPQTLTQLTTIYTESENYALGGRIQTLSIAGETHRLSWQSGSNGSFKSIAIYDPSRDIGYAIVTHGDSLDSIQARRDQWIDSRLRGETEK